MDGARGARDPYRNNLVIPEEQAMISNCGKRSVPATLLVLGATSVFAQSSHELANAPPQLHVGRVAREAMPEQRTQLVSMLPCAVSMQCWRQGQCWPI
jgi:hypothetical protein